MKKILIILLFTPLISWSQNFGCTDSLALNFDPTADVDDGSCLYCNSLASFSNDTIISLDSLILLNVLEIPSANYTWNSSNIYDGQDIQTLLNYGYTPLELNNLLIQNPNFGSIDSLYNKVYQGGLIFYLDTLSGRGFVAALNDEVATTWGWGCIIGDTIGQMTSDSLFSGENNTNLILNGSGPACSQLGIAAELCNSSNQQAYNDWFLPSQDELGQLYQNLFFIDSLSFASDFYWSSSEEQTIEALYLNALGWNFITGAAMVMPKNHTHSVRPIKDFNNSASNFITVFEPGWNTVTVNAFGCSSTDSVYVILDSIVTGCTDALAINYNLFANTDDGSCEYQSNCTMSIPDGLYSFDIIDSRAKIGWNNMNDSSCMVLKYFVRFREVGTNSWTTKSAGVGNGLCNFGLNTVSKQLLNLNPSTTYEFKMKAFYCGGSTSNYSSSIQFTTLDECPDMSNLSVETFNNNASKAKFSWDTTGAYIFARITLRADTLGASWQTAGGFGIHYPTLFVNKFGLQSGQSYRAQGRTFCDSNITAYRSPTWTSPIFWTQPVTIRLEGGVSIMNLDVYPNPSIDVFNICFSSDVKQDLNIRILSLLGDEVYNENKEQFIGEYTKKINLYSFDKGIYFLEVETSKEIVVRKVVLN